MQIFSMKPLFLYIGWAKKGKKRRNWELIYKFRENISHFLSR